MIFSLWLFWALMTAVSWSVGQVVAKKSLAFFSPLSYNVLSSLVGSIVYLSYAYSLGFDLKRVTVLEVLLTVLICALFILFYYALASEEVSLSGTILSAYPVATVLLSVWFLKENLKLFQFALILTIITGSMLIGWPKKRLSLKKEVWFLFCLLTALLVGLADFLSKVVIGRVGLSGFVFLFGFGPLPGLALTYLWGKKGRRLPKLSSRIWFFSILGAFFMEMGNIFLFTAFSKGPASLVSPVSSIYVALTVILALIFLKEKLRPIQKIGISLMVLALLLFEI